MRARGIETADTFSAAYAQTDSLVIDAALIADESADVLLEIEENERRQDRRDSQ